MLGPGGSKGVFAAGVLRYLLDTENIDYQIYCGVSVGAINASILATGPLSETLPQLEQIWLEDIKGSNSIYSSHLWNYILTEICIIVFFVIAALISFFFGTPKFITCLFMFFAAISIYLPYFTLKRSNSIYNSEPLRNILKTRLDLNKLSLSGKNLRIGAVSYETGEYKVVNESDPDLIAWIMASSAFPILFPMECINGRHYTDIGAYNMAPIKEALDLGATEIDVILTNPLIIGNEKRSPGIVWQLLRMFEITSNKAIKNDINLHTITSESVSGYKLKVRIFAPSEPFNIHLLNFDPMKIKEIYQRGKIEAELYKISK